MLFWDEDNAQWRLESYKDPDVYATTNATEYPIGILEWEVFGEDCLGASSDNSGNETRGASAFPVCSATFATSHFCIVQA